MTSDTGPALAEVLARFEEVVGLDPAARQARLDAMGGSDPTLRHAVEELMAADSSADITLMRLEACLGEPPRESDPLQLVGRTVAEFRVLEPLGHGGMGVVYRAEDTRLGRPVALKFPLASRHYDPAARQRFRREARLAAALDHPNLCPVHATGETPEGDLYYAMPLYEGQTLKARLEREGALPLAETVQIAVQLARGLGAAHDAGIVHRDLKPGNVMLLPDGGVRILDFGLAKASDLSLTLSWARFGTVAYMAPEQVRGDQVDARADLWAIGVVLHEMVTGSRPFGGGHEIGIAHAILHEEPPTASARRDDVPAELDEVIRTLLRKDPRERYASAQEVVAALAGVPRHGGSRRRRRIRAWRTPLLSATALGALAGGGLLARRAAVAPREPIALAVLPFERLGDSVSSHHLAVGLGDAIGRDLGRLRHVVTPSAVTTSAYRAGVRPLKEIAAELQVRALLRGSVRRSGERVWVEARLFDAEERELWAQRYDRPATELPSLEREIVRSSLVALRVRPDEPERELLDRTLTTRSDAYDRYLRGRAAELDGHSGELWHRVPDENIRRAQSLYTQARDLDPEFAAARARLALVHTSAAATYDTSAARREQARLEAEAALRLQPGLAEAHEALAYYWDLGGNPAKAIEELGLALRGYPNSADLRMALGYMLARAGRLEEAVAEMDRAMRLEPGSPRAAFAAALFQLRLRRDADAMRAFDRALALAPDYHMVKVIKGHTYLRWKGIPDTLAAAMETVPLDWDPDGMATWARYTALWAQRRYADALAMLDRSRARLSRDGLVYQPMPLMRARLYDTMGERKSARASYLEARDVLEDSAAARPGDASIRIALGLAYAGLGRTADAMREARRAMELVPLASNTPAATAFMGGAVEVFARAGETGAALELLELLFSMPAGREVTLAYLRVWPGFDGLRDDPRFEALLERYAATG
jgi:TolB-like protein/Flp pilus assembly protein TadD